MSHTQEYVTTFITTILLFAPYSKSQTEKEGQTDTLEYWNSYVDYSPWKAIVLRAERTREHLSSKHQIVGKPGLHQGFPELQKKIESDITCWSLLKPS